MTQARLVKAGVTALSLSQSGIQESGRDWAVGRDLREGPCAALGFWVGTGVPWGPQVTDCRPQDRPRSGPGVAGAQGSNRAGPSQGRVESPQSLFPAPKGEPAARTQEKAVNCSASVKVAAKWLTGFAVNGVMNIHEVGCPQACGSHAARCARLRGCVRACVRACVGRAVPAAQSSSAHARTPARPRPGLASCCLGNAMATPAGCLARLRFSPFSVEPKPVNLHAPGRKRLCAACAHRCADTCARVCKRGVEWLSPPADPRAGPGLHTQPSARAQAGRVPCSGNAMVGPQSAGSVTPARMPAATPTNEAPQAQRTRGTRACPQ